MRFFHLARISISSSQKPRKPLQCAIGAARPARKRQCSFPNDPIMFEVCSSIKEFHFRSIEDSTEEKPDAVSKDFRKLKSSLLDYQERVHEVCSTSEGKVEWRQNTRNTHGLSRAPKVMRRYYNCEWTSQAFCKFLEILARYPSLTNNTKNSFKSFHICEGPGHFIAALDLHFCSHQPHVHWKWNANTLNPYHEGNKASDMFLNDSLMIGNLQNWVFGPEDDGDIFKFDGQYLQELKEKIGTFDLITADGSSYTRDDPGRQESETLPLLKAEANVALSLLNQGGNFVLKHYTCYNEETREFLLWILSFFMDFYDFKPMCSKSGNSERYLICLNFKGRHFDCNKFARRIDSHELFLCESFFTQLQKEAIWANLRHFHSPARPGPKNDGKLIRIFLERINATKLRRTVRESQLSIDIDADEQSNSVETARDSFHQNLPDGVPSRYAFSIVLLGNADFLRMSRKELIDQKIFVFSPKKEDGCVRSSLFTSPVLLHSATLIDDTVGPSQREKRS
ncbi:unnamed protein product [Caenorhabditis auriculariae]|uniref:Cap-specific mRNA (nucleoside-2'-O-)-methyltransferase 2 n=1 Tax=Caenorhabditis auriculariae TaxID=2777116 RepID=A0A8S1H596_9PELO|nr:unnamed protein product [Caenorhabditis auriculariae]